MDKDEIIKNLTSQVDSLQSRVKGYARLGELYENAQAELKQLRIHNNGASFFARDSGGGRASDGRADDSQRQAYVPAAGEYGAPSKPAPVPVSPTSSASKELPPTVDAIDKYSGDGYGNDGGSSRTVSLPMSGPGPPNIVTVSQAIRMDNTTVSVSRPPSTSLTLAQREHQATAPDVALTINNNNSNDSMTAPITFQNNNNNCESFVQYNSGSLVVAEKSADVLCDSAASQSFFTGKLADLMADGKRLEELVAKKTTEIEAKDQRIESLTQELQHVKEQLKKGQGQGGVASGWVMLTADKVQQQDGAERSSEELTEREAMQERKIAELTKTVGELKAANKCWEQHLRQVNKDNVSRHEALESECSALRQQLADNDTLRHDCDEAVAAARRQAEDAEVGRQRAVAEAVEVRSRCDQLEAALAQVHQKEREKKTGAERRCREMENILQGQREYITKLEQQLMNQSTVSMSTSQAPDPHLTDLSLPTEVMLLHQQVALWKEDFERERGDREAAQSELDTVRKVSAEDRQLLHKERDACRQLKDKLEQAEREKKDLQAKLVEKIAELQKVKEAHKHHQAPAKAAEGPKQWNCGKCTYINSTTDRYCAMCGNMSWYLTRATPSAPPRDRHLLHHTLEGSDVCDGGRVYDEPDVYNRRY